MNIPHAYTDFLILQKNIWVCSVFENLAFGEKMLSCAVILKCFEQSLKLYSMTVENIDIFWMTYSNILMVDGVFIFE